MAQPHACTVRCIKTLTAGGQHQVEVVTLPDGEQYKSLEVLQQVWDKALQSRLDRNCTFVALGGGVIGDMCGFAAASYQRGVHFIQVSFLYLTDGLQAYYTYGGMTVWK